MNNSTLKKLDNLFQDTAILELHIEQLIPYHDHPFRLYEGERLENMIHSIKDLGIINPIIVRPTKQERGKYEILAGHNRANVAKLAGLTMVPAIIKEHISDDEARWIVTESNLMQRSFNDMSYSERATVLYEHHEMLRCQGRRMDLLKEINEFCFQDTSGQLGKKLESREKVGKEFCLAPRTVSRYLRIHKLDDNLKYLLDEEKIAFTVAENISYLSLSAQQLLAEVIGELKIKISNKQATELRELAQEKEITMEVISDVLCSKEKKPSSKAIKIGLKVFEKYFTKESSEEISGIVEKALEQYYANKSV